MNGSQKHDERNDAMIIEMPDGTKRAISFEELVLSNNLTAEAIVRILIKKGIFTPDEFIKELDAIQNEREKRNTEQ